MQCFSKNMMNIFLAYFIVYFSADFNIWSDAAFAKTMIPLKKHLIGQTMLYNISLNDTKQVFISP